MKNFENVKYFNEDEFRAKARTTILEKRADFIKDKFKRTLTKKHIFLSHSHKDQELVLALQTILAEKNIELYIDWQDSSLPRVTGKETADIIKSKIRESFQVWVLATKNALESLWVPWEIGYTDGYKSDKIVILPFSVNNEEYKGNEYLKLYKSIQNIAGILKYYNPVKELNGKYIYDEIGDVKKYI